MRGRAGIAAVTVLWTLTGFIPPEPTMPQKTATHLAGIRTQLSAFAPVPLRAHSTTAPACETTVPASGIVREEPWAQRRFGAGRLSPVADGAGIVVAVIDSGVDPSHPQLAGHVLPGADFLDPGGEGAPDCVGHGTAVASLISAAPADGTSLCCSAVYAHTITTGPPQRSQLPRPPPRTTRPGRPDRSLPGPTSQDGSFGRDGSP